MTFKYFILLLLSIVTLFSSETAKESSKKHPPLQYEYHHEDRSLDLQEIMQNGISWKSHSEDTFKLVSQTNPVWFKFTLDPSNPSKNFLQLNSEFIYLCEVYLVKEANLLKQYAFGVGVTNELRSTELPLRIVPLDKRNYPTHIYIKILTMPTLSVTFVLSDTTQTLSFLQNRSFFNGIFYGILLFLFIYNFILYFYTQYTAYLPYLSYIFGITLYFLILDEYYLFSLWPVLYDVYFVLLDFVSMIAVVSMILFPIVLLKFKKQYPRVHKVLMRLLTLYIILQLVIMVTEHYGYIAYYQILYKIVAPVFILMLIIVLLTAMDLARKGERIAIMYSVAWSILILSLVNYIAQNHVLGSDVLAAKVYMMIAVIVEGLLFSFILAYRIRELRGSKNKLEKIVIEQANMVQTERMFSEIAHQWRYPLNTINAIIFEQIMQKEIPDKQTWDKTLNAIEDQTQYLPRPLKIFSIYIPPIRKNPFSASKKQ